MRLKSRVQNETPDSTGQSLQECTKNVLGSFLEKNIRMLSLDEKNHHSYIKERVYLENKFHTVTKKLFSTKLLSQIAKVRLVRLCHFCLHLSLICIVTSHCHKISVQILRAILIIHVILVGSIFWSTSQCESELLCLKSVISNAVVYSDLIYGKLLIVTFVKLL